MGMIKIQKYICSGCYDSVFKKQNKKPITKQVPPETRGIEREGFDLICRASVTGLRMMMTMRMFLRSGGKLCFYADGEKGILSEMAFLPALFCIFWVRGDAPLEQRA